MQKSGPDPNVCSAKQHGHTEPGYLGGAGEGAGDVLPTAQPGRGRPEPPGLPLSRAAGLWVGPQVRLVRVISALEDLMRFSSAACDSLPLN